jgi:macrophage erythroblast attacher
MSLGQLDDLRTIEHSTLKVPYEVLNKQYRNVQKSIDRDCSAITQSILSVDKLVKAANASSELTLNRSDLLNSFSSFIDKLRSIKKRSAEFKHEERGFTDTIRKRIDHLKQHECCGSGQLAVKSFKKIRVERMLVDYFLRQSLYDTAQLLAQKSSIEVVDNHQSQKQIHCRLILDSIFFNFQVYDKYRYIQVREGDCGLSEEQGYFQVPRLVQRE